MVGDEAGTPGHTEPPGVGELLQALRDTPARLRRVLEGFTAEALRRPPSVKPAGVEALSALGHACHLRDIEIDGYHVRIRRLRNESHAPLESLSGEQLALERAYESDDPEVVLRTFEEARRLTLETLGVLRPEEWSRSGRFEGYGAVNLRSLVGILADHDQGHLAALGEMPRE